MSNTAPSRADPVVVFPFGRWCPPQETSQPHPPQLNTLRLRQNGRRFTDDTFKCIFPNKNVRISIKISLKFVPKGPVNNNPASVQIMAWHRSGNKPLSEPMMVSLLTHICITRPQWVKVSVDCPILSWWFQMNWCLIGTRPSTTTIQMWLHYQINQDFFPQIRITVQPLNKLCFRVFKSLTIHFSLGTIKNAYELLNVKLWKFQHIKIISFNMWARYFVRDLKPSKFHTKYFSHWKINISYRGDILKLIVA